MASIALGPKWESAAQERQSIRTPSIVRVFLSVSVSVPVSSPPSHTHLPPYYTYIHIHAHAGTVRLYQAMAKPKSNAEGGSQGGEAGKVRAKDVLRNPALARLLVLAARKVKDHKQETGQDFLSTMPKDL